MFDKKIFSYIVSFLASILFIVLFIILLPSILIAVVAFTLIIMLTALVLRFLVGKKIIKTNFIYIKRSKYNADKEEVECGEMKDVTNSIKPKKGN